MKILIVDFDDESALALSEYLKSEGFQVIAAEDGEAGLEKCKAENPDLVIVEPMISKLHGFELCSIITHDFNGHIPVVILTKFYREEQFKIEATKAYGASAFLSKPFKGPEILSTIRDLLKEKIEETEEKAKEMAEDTQNLDDFSELALENLKIETKPAEGNFPVEDIENEILEPVSPLKNAPEIKDKSSEIKSQIDKMLEDTLSEFGLNLQKTPSKKTERPSEAPHVKTEGIETNQEIDVKIQIPEEKTTVKPEKESVFVASREDKSPKREEDTLAAAPEKERTIFRAMEEEGKTKVSLLSTLKNSLGHLKNLPLKFIVPVVLAAAVALSASIIFRKPHSSNPPPQNTVAAIQFMDKEVKTEPEDTIIEGEKETEGQESPADLPKESSSTQAPGSELKEEGAGAEVKTKVNEVFAVRESASQAPDIEKINMKDDVLAETPVNTPQPILPNKIPEVPQNIQTAPAIGPESLSATQRSEEQGATVPEEGQQESQPVDNSNSITPGDLLPIEDVDIEPEIAKRVDPKYPSMAFQRGIEGKVVINVLVSETGDVIETALIKGIGGPYGFNEECEKAVRQWKFVPAFKSGVKVKVWKTISFTFKKS